MVEDDAAARAGATDDRQVISLPGRLALDEQRGLVRGRGRSIAARAGDLREDLDLVQTARDRGDRRGAGPAARDRAGNDGDDARTGVRARAVGAAGINRVAREIGLVAQTNGVAGRRGRVDIDHVVLRIEAALIAGVDVHATRDVHREDLAGVRRVAVADARRASLRLEVDVAGRGVLRDDLGHLRHGLVERGRQRAEAASGRELGTRRLAGQERRHLRIRIDEVLTVDSRLLANASRERGHRVGAARQLLAGAAGGDLPRVAATRAGRLTGEDRVVGLRALTLAGRGLGHRAARAIEGDGGAALIAQSRSAAASRAGRHDRARRRRLAGRARGTRRAGGHGEAAIRALVTGRVGSAADRRAEIARHRRRAARRIVVALAGARGRIAGLVGAAGLRLARGRAPEGATRDRIGLAALRSATAAAERARHADDRLAAHLVAASAPSAAGPDSTGAAAANCTRAADRARATNGA